MAKRLQRSKMAAESRMGSNNKSLPTPSWGHASNEENTPGPAWWGGGQWASLHPMPHLNSFAQFESQDPNQPGGIPGWITTTHGDPNAGPSLDKPPSSSSGSSEATAAMGSRRSEKDANVGAPELALVPSRPANNHKLEAACELGLVPAGVRTFEHSGVSIDLAGGIVDQDLRKILRTPQTLPFVQYVCSLNFHLLRKKKILLGSVMCFGDLRRHFFVCGMVCTTLTVYKSHMEHVYRFLCVCMHAYTYMHIYIYIYIYIYI
jgi:hypothetical protein